MIIKTFKIAKNDDMNFIIENENLLGEKETLTKCWLIGYTLKYPFDSEGKYDSFLTYLNTMTQKMYFHLTYDFLEHANVFFTNEKHIDSIDDILDCDIVYDRETGSFGRPADYLKTKNTYRCFNNTSTYDVNIAKMETVFVSDTYVVYYNNGYKHRVYKAGIDLYIDTARINISHKNEKYQLIGFKFYTTAELLTKVEDKEYFQSCLDTLELDLEGM